jgi:hypothetical protein
MRKLEQILLMLKKRANTKKARHFWRIVILIYHLLFLWLDLRLNTRLFDNTSISFIYASSIFSKIDPRIQIAFQMGALACLVSACLVSSSKLVMH